MKIASSKSILRSEKPDRRTFMQMNRAPIFVVLDNLKSAFNVGSIFRVADALLIQKVYLCGTTIIPPHHKIKTTSRGTERWVPWEYRKSTRKTVQELKDGGAFILCAEITSESVDYTKINPSFPVCLVLGREYDGISTDVLELANCIVSLPIYGMTNSLNVAITGSVLLYELSQKIRAGSS
ncbi:MAG: RNA methyltransferase [Candidatus Peregrinibacteria bacterium]